LQKTKNHRVVAVGAADASEALLQVTALQKGFHRALDDRTRPARGYPAILGRKPLAVHLLKAVKTLIQQPPQVGLAVWPA
jgi:hypothetical protein